MKVTLAGANPVTGLAHMLGLQFVQHALLAGTAIALLSGVVGYFVVLRGQVFAGDALSHVAFTGAMAALAAGVDLRFGLFAATVAVGLALGLLESVGGTRAAQDDAVTGVVFAWVLGLGVFFLAYFARHSGSGNGAASTRVLFGSIFGISSQQAVQAVIIAIVLLFLLLGMARPLLFASLDPAVAAARGVPVRMIAALFLGIVGASAAEASQAIGALLLFGLLAAPPAAAQRLTSRPWVGLALAGVLAVLAVWLGVAFSYAWPQLPPSFTIMAVSTTEFVLAIAWSTVRRTSSDRVSAAGGSRSRPSAPGTARTPRPYG